MAHSGPSSNTAASKRSRAAMVAGVSGGGDRSPIVFLIRIEQPFVDQSLGEPDQVDLDREHGATGLPALVVIALPGCVALNGTALAAFSVDVSHQGTMRPGSKCSRRSRKSLGCALLAPRTERLSFHFWHATLAHAAELVCRLRPIQRPRQLLQ